MTPTLRRPLRRRLFRVLRWALLALCVLAATGFYVWRQGTLPIMRGRLPVRELPAAPAQTVRAGEQASITIERDADGVPTIRAASLEQAIFGLGFAHAQDRLWQLETHKRIGSGRLAEAFGPGALDTDRFLRALAVRRAAEQQWSHASQESKTALQAYAAGINAWVREHMRARPPEFLILGLYPEDWTPVDSLAWAIMMAWDLGGNWSSELLRLRLALQMPVSRINELLPPYPGTAPVQTADYAALARQWRVSSALIDRTAALAAPESGVEGVGSNNWVVDGAHSSTGKPLLANDPHLRLTAPALWYFARIDVPGLQLAGASMPGLPMVVLGQNQHIAWGFTNTNPDVQDLYLERLHPDDAGVYETPGGWARFEEQDETIKVKGGADVRVTVRLSRHGPVISDANAPATRGLLGASVTAAAGQGGSVTTSTTAAAQPAVMPMATNTPGLSTVADRPASATAPAAGPGAPASAAVRPGSAASAAGGAEPAPRYVMALRWTALDPDADTVAAGLAFNRARSVAEFVNAAADYVAPMQNMVVADAEGARGHIGFVAAGRVPLRKAENDLQGQVPSPGWDARYDWADYLDPALTPRDRDPARGWIATANERIHPPEYPYYLTSEWVAPYRAQRIQQLLAARPVHDLASFAAIQGDTVSLGARRLLPSFQKALSEHALAGRLAPLITTFDGSMDADSAAPAIFHVWARHLTQLVFADELGPLWEREFGTQRSFRDGLERVMERDDAWWCDNKLTREQETCAELANTALNRALDELQGRLGKDPDRWRWGDLHTARAEHRPFSKVPALAWLFEQRVPVGGDGHTVNVSRVNLKPDPVTGELYITEHGPSLRALYDVADPANSRFIYSTGQSGNALSGVYRRFKAAWAENRTVPLWPPAGSPAGDVLTLVPARP